MATCVVCNATFKARRLDARLCSPRCRKAASRSTGGAQDGDVTDNLADSTPAPVTPAVEPAPDAVVIDLGSLPGDTVRDRRWRIQADADGFTLQCEALVPGGWMRVTREPTLQAVRRFAAWMGLTIGPVELAEQPIHQDLAAVAA